ncbi:MAG: DUF2905 domain-containing protein [Oscillochloridaceae bacterium]|nr:DUF2905 domain-containing protein [Oscillochloridaceae bacterium]
MFGEIGRWLIGIGVALVGLGLLFLLLGRVPWLGRLPGDIVIERPGLTVYIPLGTMLLISLVLTLLANLIGRFWR